MKIISKTIHFAQHEFILTNKRALYWPDEKCLILSDVHFGKAAHFRKNGIAIPNIVQTTDLLRLQELLHEFAPSKVIIVGDLVHTNENSDIATFYELTIKNSLIEFILVQGNHDRLDAIFFQRMGIKHVYNDYEIKNVYFTHQPQSIPDKHIICGHIHPGIRIKLIDRTFIKLPCFLIKSNLLILPAFSMFTGLDTNYLSNDSKIFAFDEYDIYEF